MRLVMLSEGLERYAQYSHRAALTGVPYRDIEDLAFDPRHLTLYDEEQVVERYKGLRPNQLADLRGRVALAGDCTKDDLLVVLDYPTAAALSFLLMLTILVLVIVYLRRVPVEEVI